MSEWQQEPWTGSWWLGIQGSLPADPADVAGRRRSQPDPVASLPPRWIEFVDELPKTATGKTQRYKLRQE